MKHSTGKAGEHKAGQRFLSLAHWNLDIVSDFNFRISNLSFPKFRIPNLILLMVLALLLINCGDKQTTGDTAVLPGDDEVLARVDGTPVTRYELDQSIASTLGPRGGQMLDQDGRQNMLESLVMARAIALAQEKAMSSEQKSALAKKTAAFREQLLVKMYLADNADTEPVTRQMVQAYYDKHPEQFGASTIRTYEILNTQGAMTDAVRDKAIEAMAAAVKQTDWPAAAKDLKNKGLPVIYRKASSETKILDARVRGLINPLKAGQTSAPTFINDVLYVVRVVEDKKISPRPLAEVSADIRKILLPVQLKKAVKQASEKVLAETGVEYVAPADRDVESEK